MVIPRGRRMPVMVMMVAMAFSQAWGWELDERPPEPGDWGYRPEQGTTPEVNPPGFTWRPVDQAQSYDLQVARDEAFADLAYEAVRWRWSAHCPPRPLTPGMYFWRYRARDEADAVTPWSRARAFHVSVTAPRLPQPTIAELKARLPQGHPRLFFRPEDVAGLSELARGAFADRWQALVAQADKLVASPPDLSEPPLYPEGMDRKSGAWKAIWWGNRQRMIDVVDGAATLAFVYRLGGGEAYGRAARDLLLAVCAWDPKGSTSFPYNDEAAMPTLYMASRAYTWAYPVFSVEDRARIVTMMEERGRQAFQNRIRGNHLWRPYDSHGNRTWHLLGELAVAFQDEIPEAETWLDFAMTVMYTAYPVWSDADGGWHEGVAYWLSYQEKFTWWAEIVRSAFGIDVFERPFFQRAGYFPMYVMPPGSQTGGFGDQAELMSAPRAGGLMAVLAAGARNPHWKWYAEQTGGDYDRGYLGFLFARRGGDLPAKAPDDLPSSVCFRATGVAVLNTNLLDATRNLQVHFKSSPMGTQSHGYNSNNSFLLNLRGERAFLASGRRDVHGSPHHVDWMWETKSGNGILVNGTGQKKHSFWSRGAITAFAASSTVDVVEGETRDEASGLERWKRRILFLKPSVVVLHDVLDASEPSTFQWLLHAKGPFILGENQVAWNGKPGALKVTFLEPPGLVLTQTDRYDTPPGAWTQWNLEEWHMTADAQDKATHREFVTVITADDADPRPVLERNENGFRLTLALMPGDAVLTLGADRFEVVTPDFRQAFPQANP